LFFSLFKNFEIEILCNFVASSTTVPLIQNILFMVNSFIKLLKGKVINVSNFHSNYAVHVLLFSSLLLKTNFQMKKIIWWLDKNIFIRKTLLFGFIIT
jgi:hypothetical protein